MDREKIKKKLDALIDEGDQIYSANIFEYDRNLLRNHPKDQQESAIKAFAEIILPKRAYQAWYDKAYEVVRIFSPRRLEEFEEFYTGNSHIIKTDDLDSMNAGITHYLQSWELKRFETNIDFFETFEKKFRAQIYILVGIKNNINHDLFHLESNFQYGLSKSELDIAKELKENKHLRAAGAIAGVVIEVHLRAVATKRNITLPTNPQMKHYNEALKGKAYDATITKQIELCSIIRNRCAHASDNPPTDDEVNTIISIAEKIIATVN